MNAKTAITIRRPAEDVYSYWHDFTRLPEFMFHLREVRKNADGTWHWVANAPAGAQVEWDAEVIEDEPNRVIAWKSSGGEIENSGTVRFTPAPGDRGTEVHVEVEYNLPGGALGELVLKLFGEEPTQQVKDDVRRFKQIMETGEVVVSDGSPDGSRTQRQFHQHDAQPPA